MARITKDQKLANVHAEALSLFDDIQTTMAPERSQCLADRRFYSIPGAQWEGPLGTVFEKRPKFEVNKVHLAVIRIINEYRNNRITVNFTSKDGASDNKLADTCDGLYRADEQDSGAEEAYDNAFEEAVGGGFGAYRLRACYEDESDDENEKQRIRIEPIYDADSCVFFDLNSKRQDKADAKHCFVLSSMTPSDYEEEWGDSPSTWPKTVSQAQFDWASPDLVYVAEYYRVEETREWVRVFRDLQGNETRYRQHEFDEDESLEETLLATGNTEVRKKKAKRRQVHKYILSGGGVLEDCGYVPGGMIPIVPAFGKRWFVDGVERCMGHVRLAKDAQRLKNVQLSKLGEISALSSVQKPIFTPEQVAGHQIMWADDNLKNYPYLLLNPVTDAAGQALPTGPIGYTKPPDIPPAMGALLQVTEQDMQEILGNPQGADKMVSNISGKAVELIQTRLDMQTFIYMSNFAKAVRRGGEIWLAMAREVYVEEGRTMKMVGTNGETDTVELGRPVVNPKTQTPELENDLSVADFDVTVEVGPSSNSKREATVRALTNMLGLVDDPETKQVLQSMVLMNMEGEGIQDVRDYFRTKLVRAGVVEPTEDEKAELAQAAANQLPDPQAEYLKAAAAEAAYNAKLKEAQTVETLTNAELKEAQTVETRVKSAKMASDIDIAQSQNTLKLLSGIPRPTLSEENGTDDDYRT